MNLLVTGSTGFLGRYLVQHLVATFPKTEIHTVARKGMETPGCHHHVCDLTDPKQVESLIDQLRPAQVYHLAGIARVTDQIDIKSYYFQNSLTTQVLLQALEFLESPVAFFLSSSVHVYGNQHGLISEKSELNPESPYGFTKYLAEEALRSAVQKNAHIRGVVGRLYSCFGPGQPKGFVAADVCEKIRLLGPNNTSALKVGPTDTFRRFIDVRDAVRIFPILLKAKPDARFEVFNIASPHELTIQKMIEILLRLSNTTAPIESSGSSANMFKGLRVDISRLEEFVPPSSFRPVEATLKDMLTTGS